MRYIVRDFKVVEVTLVPNGDRFSIYFNGRDSHASTSDDREFGHERREDAVEELRRQHEVNLTYHKRRVEEITKALEELQ